MIYMYVLLVFATVGIQETKEFSRYHYNNEYNKYRRRMWAQEIHRVLKSQQISISVMHGPNTACSLGHHHNGFMSTG